VLRKTSPEALLESYIASSAALRPTRIFANRPDRLTSWRRFRARRRGSAAVLSLAKETEFGKRMINGGWLSVPPIYDSPLSTAD
jgi:3-(3-hydroxy-phenyl)propionate hydroxylase